jgi:hypothetical protein
VFDAIFDYLLVSAFITQRSFIKYDNKHYDADNSILTLLYSWHMCSTWYTPYLHIVTDNLSAPLQRGTTVYIMA